MDKSLVRSGLLVFRKRAFDRADTVVFSQSAHRLWGAVCFGMGWHCADDWQGKIVGSYYSIGAEMPTAPLHDLVQHRGAVNALPVVSGRDMPFAFYPYGVGDTLGRDGMGIPAPVVGDGVAPVVPDVVVVPLVGFDLGGHRLGMGGGFYDRTLPLLKQANPDMCVVGYGFDCQRVDCVPTEPHDVPLDCMVTDSQVYWF